MMETIQQQQSETEYHRRHNTSGSSSNSGKQAATMAQQPKQHQQQQQQRTPRSPPVKEFRPDSSASSSEVQSPGQPNMAYQHKHALHRLRRLKKRSPHRDLVISFVPRLRISIINRLDFFLRYSKQEQEVLSCFDFLDELIQTYCDEATETPQSCQKLYQTMIHELIQS